MKIVKYRRSGEMVRWGYGVAYRRFDRDEDVCYPIPLNLVVFLARELYFVLAFPFRFSVIDRVVSWAYHKGFQRGYQVGHRFHEDRCLVRLVESIRQEILR